MTRLAVFDCDGTLVDGLAAVCEAMGRAFGICGFPPPERAAIRRIVGLSLPQAVRHLAPELPPAQRAQVVEEYKTAFRNAREEGRLEEPLFPGIADLLGRLKADGWLLGIATGKSDRGLAACLAGHRLTGHFTSVQTADRHPSKPDPAMLHAALAEAGAQPHEAVMIGDTVFDMAMAQAAGVRAVGVAWGYHAPHELLDAGASAVAQDGAELERLIHG